jgi:hypothetical protein
VSKLLLFAVKRRAPYCWWYDDDITARHSNGKRFCGGRGLRGGDVAAQPRYKFFFVDCRLHHLRSLAIGLVQELLKQLAQIKWGDPSTAPWPGDHHDATVAIPVAKNLLGCLGRHC